MQSFLAVPKLVTLSLFLSLTPVTLAQTNFTLEEAWKLLPQSLNWRASNQAYLIAERSLNIARGAAGLSLNIGADLSRNQVSSSTDPALNGSAVTGSINAQASLAILPWSPAFDGVRAAERNLERAKLDLLENHSNLQLQLLNQYLSIQLLQTDVALANQNQVFAKLRLQITQAQFVAKTTTREAVLNAEAALKSAEANARAIANAKNNAIRGFLINLGQTPKDIILSSSLKPILIEETSLGNYIKQAQSNRLDLRRAALNLREAEDNLAIATRDRWLPNLGINTTISGIGSDGKPTGTQLGASLNLGTGTLGINGAYSPNASSATSTSISVQISIPIVAPIQDARIDTAQAALEATRLNFENIQNNIELEVQSKFYQYLAASAQVELAKANLESSLQRRTDTEAKLAAGLSTTLELEQSKLSESQATREIQNAVQQSILSAYQFFVSIKPLEYTNFRSLI